MSLKERIGRALDSPKVSTNMESDFYILLKRNPNVDLSREMIFFLVQGSSYEVEIEGSICAIGDVYAVYVPYSKLPELVQNSDLLWFEGGSILRDY